MKRQFSLIAVCLFFISAFTGAIETPVYVLQVPNPNDYTLFANGGWDGNWYVGYNTCWIKKLPAVPAGSYARAYVGAKLGRMKLQPVGKKPWEQKALPGEIYMAIRSTPAWSAGDGVRLTATDQIPSDGDSQNAVTTVGESEWFWAEIPLSAVHLKGENYLALWSPTPEMLSISSAPVVAAAWSGNEVNAWLARDVHGTPPSDAAKSLATGISYFQPAMALKLIPTGPPHPLNVRVTAWKDGTADHPWPVISAAIDGDSVERAWMEYSADQKTWRPVGRPLWRAPFIFSLDITDLPKGRLTLRVAAVNVWEERAASSAFSVDVSNVH